MATMSTYTVRATRDGRFWLIEVPELGHYTQARNVGEIETMARDLIAVVVEIDPASVVLDVQITMPGGAAEHLRRAEEARAEEPGRVPRPPSRCGPRRPGCVTPGCRGATSAVCSGCRSSVPVSSPPHASVAPRPSRAAKPKMRRRRTVLR